MKAPIDTALKLQEFLQSILSLKSLLLSSAHWKIGTDWTQMNQSPYLFLPTQFSRQNSWCFKCGLKWLNVAFGWWENYSFPFGRSRCGKKLLEACKTKQNKTSTQTANQEKRKQSTCWPWRRTPWKSSQSDFTILFKILFLSWVDSFWFFFYLFHLYFLSGFISPSLWSHKTDVFSVLMSVIVWGGSRRCSGLLKAVIDASARF